MAIGADCVLCLQHGTSRPPVSATSRAGVYRWPPWWIVTTKWPLPEEQGYLAPPCSPMARVLALSWNTRKKCHNPLENDGFALPGPRKSAHDNLPEAAADTESVLTFEVSSVAGRWRETIIYSSGSVVLDQSLWLYPLDCSLSFAAPSTIPTAPLDRLYWHFPTCWHRCEPPPRPSILQ
jgi:hypothetical protein